MHRFRLLVLLLLVLLVVACSKEWKMDDRRPRHTTPVDVQVRLVLAGPMAGDGQPLPEVLQRLSLPMLEEGCRDSIFMSKVTVQRVDLDRSEPQPALTYRELRATFDKPAGMDVGGERILERARERQQGKLASGLLVQPSARTVEPREMEAELERLRKESGKEALVVLAEAPQQERLRAQGIAVAPQGEGMSKVVAAQLCALHGKKAPMVLSVVLWPRPEPREIRAEPGASASTVVPPVVPMAPVAVPVVTPSQLPLTRTTVRPTLRAPGPQPAPASSQPSPSEAQPGTVFLTIGGQVAPPRTVQLYQTRTADQTARKNAREGYTGLPVAGVESR